MIFIVK